MITTDINKVIYVSDGTTTEYDFSFTVYDKSHLKVYIQSPDSNKPAVLEEANYNVVLNEDYSGGKIILNSPLPQNTKISIIREVDKTQEIHYIEGSPFPAQSHERALDKLTMITQQLDEKISRIPQGSIFNNDIDFDDLYNSIQYCSNNIEALAKSISMTVNTIKDLIAIDTTNLTDKTAVFVLGYHEPNDGGGGVFYWDTQEDKNNHNGGTIIDPTAIFPTDWSDTTQQNVWFSSSNNGNGVWKRTVNNTVNGKWFGAVGNGIINDTLALQSALNNFKKVFLLNGAYAVTGINIPSDTMLEGEGRLTTIKLITTSGITLGTPSQQFNGCIKNLKILVTKDGTVALDTSNSANNAIVSDLYIESYPETNTSENNSIGLKIYSDDSHNNGYWQNYNNITIKGFNTAIDINTNDVRFFGLNVLRCFYGIKFTSAYFVNFYGCNFEFSGGSGAGVIHPNSTAMENVNFFGIRSENMGNITIPSFAKNCSIIGYRSLDLIKNYSSSTLLVEGNMFRDGIKMSNRVEGAADTTDNPSKLSVGYVANSSVGLGENDGSFQFNRVTINDGDSGIFGYFRYRGEDKKIGVLGLFRTGTGNPTSYITPLYVGEEFLDTVNKKWYKSVGLSPDDWVPIN